MATHTHNKSHLEIVVQTLRKKGKVLTKGEKIKSIYETALGSSHWDNVVSVGIFFWHRRFKERVKKKKKGKEEGQWHMAFQKK